MYNAGVVCCLKAFFISLSRQGCIYVKFTKPPTALQPLFLRQGASAGAVSHVSRPPLRSDFRQEKQLLLWPLKAAGFKSGARRDNASTE